MSDILFLSNVSQVFIVFYVVWGGLAVSSGEIVFINLDYKQVSLTMGQTGQVLRVDYPGHEREIMVLSEESLQLSLTPLLILVLCSPW